MAISPVAKKLGIKPEMKALIIAAPAGYVELLAPLPEGVVVSEVQAGAHQFVQFFATRKAEIVKAAPKLLKHAAPGALVWIAYPKKTSKLESDLSREEVWDAMKNTEWRPVSQIAIDEVWSALRFRPVKDVKTRGSAALQSRGLRTPTIRG
jgi:predicted SnoaL-like aldol condensation-catalyzing enzyme